MGIFNTLYYNPVLVRQEVDYHAPAPPSKVIGDIFPVNWNSKTRISGQLREEVEPCPGHVFLIFEVRRPPDHTFTESLLEGEC